MANDRKQGFLSSLFGRRKQTEQEEMAELESKRRLEARIEQVLAERFEVPEPIKLEEGRPAIVPKVEEEDFPVELLPISASVISIRKTPVPAPFLRSSVDEVRAYAANDR